MLFILSNNLEDWNKNSFSSKLKETKQLKERINRIQNRRALQCSPFLQDLERSLLVEYADDLIKRRPFGSKDLDWNGSRRETKIQNFFMLQPNGILGSTELYVLKVIRALLSPQNQRKRTYVGIFTKIHTLLLLMIVQVFF